GRRARAWLAPAVRRVAPRSARRRTSRLGRPIELGAGRPRRADADEPSERTAALPAIGLEPGRVHGERAVQARADVVVEGTERVAVERAGEVAVQGRVVEVHLGLLGFPASLGAQAESGLCLN